MRSAILHTRVSGAISAGVRNIAARPFQRPQIRLDQGQRMEANCKLANRLFLSKRGRPGKGQLAIGLLRATPISPLLVHCCAARLRWAGAVCASRSSLIAYCSCVSLSGSGST